MSPHFGPLAYQLIKDGGEGVLFACPSCSLETYINEPDDNGKVKGCVYCEFKLDICSRCGTDLTPNDLYGYSEELCTYCGRQWAKVMEKD